MGVDTIVKIPGKIESNKIFDFIKEHFDKNAVNGVQVKVQSQELFDDLKESDYVILGTEVIFESGFIHFQYKEGDDVVLTGLSDEVVKLYDVDGDDVSATVKGRLKVMQFICKPIFDEYSDEKGDIQEVEFDSFEINIVEGDEVKEVKPTHDGRHSLLIITENGFIYSNANYNPRYALGQTAKDVADNYPFFVGLEPGTHRNVFTLSNENREIVKVEVVKTHDRGYTTNVIN